MPYASTSDIHLELPGTVIPVTSTDNNAVDDAVLALWLAQESAKIDAAIASRYVLPITGAASLLVLKGICIAFVTWRVVKATDEKNEQQLPSYGSPFAQAIPQTPNVAQAKKSAELLLAAIQEGTSNLIDAVAIVGISSYQVDHADCPVFHTPTSKLPTQW